MRLFCDLKTIFLRSRFLKANVAFLKLFIIFVERSLTRELKRFKIVKRDLRSSD